MIIYDQIETAPSDTYTGSYGSAVFFANSTIFTTGSFTRQVIGDSATAWFSTNSLVGRKYLLSDYPRLYTAPLNKTLAKTSFNRFSVNVCPEEQYADSVVGHPIGYSYVNGVSASVIVPQSFAYQDTDGHSVLGVPAIAATSSIMLFIGTSSCNISMTDGAQEQFCDNIWNYTGPFQSRYKLVQRLQSPSFRAPTVGQSRVSRSFIANENLHRNAANYTASYDSISILSYVTRSGAANSVPTAMALYMDVALSGASATNLVAEFVPRSGLSIPFMTTKVLYATYFGFGDGVHSFPKASKETHLVSSINYQLNYVPELRGWKFGLYHAQPRFSTALWRYGKFGQFRDMLEQRPFTKFYNKNTFLGSAVRVSFVTSSTEFTLARDYVTATNPTYDTRDSGFYDYEYKCGQPFTDIEPID